MVVLPNLAFAVGLLPPDIIVLPFSFLLMNVCFAWAIFRHKLFTLVPVARDKMVDNMSDGMIVLDTDNRVVDMNAAARDAFSITNQDFVGQSVFRAFEAWPGLIGHLSGADRAKAEITACSHAGERYYDLRITGLLDKLGRKAGRLIMFTDITERKLIEREKDRLLAELNQKNLELEKLYSMALDANPMTGLPGNNSVAAAITRAMQDGRSACVVYTDLDNFKAFNDKYGFALGDEVIRFTADLLKRSVVATESEDAFIGHIGGDDFVLLVPSEKYREIVNFIIQEFDARIGAFYEARDLAQGFISSINRKGGTETFPIMSISMAGVDLSISRYCEYMEVNDACAELKKKSKSIPGSAFSLDLRGLV